MNDRVGVGVAWPRRAAPALVALAVFVALAGCGRDGASPVDATEKADPEAALRLVSTIAMTRGPNNEAPTSTDAVPFTADDLVKIRYIGATAAVVMDHMSDEASRARVDGLRQQFARMGVRVVAVEDARRDPDRQRAALEELLRRRTDIIVSSPVDPGTGRVLYQEAARRDVSLVFLNDVPVEMQAGVDYASAVASDDWGNGVAAGHLAALTLKRKGKLATIYHEPGVSPRRSARPLRRTLAPSPRAASQRYEAFQQAVRENYPEIEVVDGEPLHGPDFVAEAERAAARVISQNPDLDAFWVAWDVPVAGVIAAARAAGKDDLAIVAMDLSRDVADELARGGLVKAVAAQRPFDQGVAAAKLSGLWLLRETPPPFVVSTAFPVRRDNVVEAWEKLYGRPAPRAVRQAAASAG